MNQSANTLEQLSVAERLELIELARSGGLKAKGDRSRLPSITPAGREGALALSFAQQRLWFLSRFEGTSTAYHIAVGLRLIGRLERGALVRALDRIVARHEALRTVFVQGDDGMPVQRIAAAAGFALSDHDLCGAAEAAGELQRLVAVEATASFDLERGPLIRGRLVRLAADEHVLLLTMHHIVSDGWSMGVLTRELGALYRAFAHGEADPLPPLAIQYGDYAVWQRRWLSGEVLARRGAYWKEALSGAPALLELPWDRPRPAEQDHAGAVVPIRLDARLTEALKALSHRHGTTLYMTLLAGWAALLSRLSGQKDVVIGSPVANRGRAEIDGLIGFFVNTLALRVDLSGPPSVSELLARVKAQTVAAQEHQDLPFEQVVELLQPSRSLSHAPLFQAVLVWQNLPAGRLDLGELRLEAVEVPRVSAQFDLTLSLAETGGTISGGLEYATALFDRGTIERWVGYLVRLLDGMVTDEHAAVDRLPLQDDAERHRVVVEWNATAAAYPQDVCVHELFEAQAERTPDAVAVVHEDRRLSYAELNTQANRLAHHLRKLGVKPDDRVAICIERSIDLVAAELAILKCGAAYVPLDPAYPAERLSFMIEDCEASLVLTARGAVLPEGLEVHSIDVGDVLRVAGDDSNPGVSRDSGSDAYIMYTSGSTGTPKGVVIPHRAIGRLVINNGYADFNASDRVAFAANPAFDATTMEVWAPLLNGGCIVVIEQEAVLDPLQLSDAFQQQRVTAFFVTTSLFNHYVKVSPQLFAGLRFLLTGGERADPQCFRKVISGAAPRHFIHCYGPTETTTFAITHEITEVDERAGSIPLGRPISNTHIYILDAYGEPAPIGVAGEIYIGGAGVARGYLNRPELTAARFVEDRFSGEAGARLYRTGDLGRWLGDGTIAYLGRNDFQVKIRGFRIELGEIEARLSEHAGVRDVAVVAREDAPGDKRLVAYYVSDAAIGAEQLRGHLAARLPDYMVPAAYVHLDRLPLTPNGKLDRKALPAPEGTAFAAQAYEPPQGETEEVIARIWSELLGVERIGRHDNFFALGGHSLLLAKMQVRLSQAGLSLSIPRIFANPTIASLLQNDGNSPTLDFESHVVELRSPAATEAKPLFIMSQGQGSVLYGAKLAARLPDGFPIYGLTSDGQRRDHLRTVEDIAACFVAIIKQIQPAGPYRLAGWSFGGKLAYEVARQLLSADNDVQFVGLIDTYYRRPTWISEEVMDRFLSSLSPALRQTTRRLINADNVYESEYIPIKICLFVAEAPNEDAHRGWKEVLPEHQIVTIQIPGAHDDVMSDGNIEVLVQSLSEQLLTCDETGQIG